MTLVPPKTWNAPLICLALVAVVTLIYAQVGDHLFLAYDDDLYITNNPRVTAGLTLSGVAWAFASTHASNWMPLTWLSHMLDVQLFGLEPRGHHLTNVALHAVNSLLLFCLFRRLTGCLWRPALLALLFAVHPLHVESVAWAAERKDLLCGLFFLLTLWFYAGYVRHRGTGAYLLALLAFGLGLLSKPMIVTLPLVLLLLEQWPLARPAPPGQGPARLVLVDKIPFLLGSAGLAVITLISQARGGSVASLASHPLPERLANAALATLAYVGKTLWPVRLTVFYPYPDPLPAWQVAAAGVFLVVLTGLALRRRQDSPYLVVGWLWFIGTLLPVIGLIQVGEQAMADRYAYLPIIGLLVILVWGGEALGRRFRLPSSGAGGAALCLIALLSAAAWRQTGFWQDQFTLFSHAVAVTDKNHVAHFQLGNALVGMGRLEEAATAFARSIAIRPTAKAHNNLAFVQERRGLAGLALANYRRATALAPGSVESHYNLGLLLLRQWQLDEAIAEFTTALRLDPSLRKAAENRERARRVQASGHRPP